MKEVQYIKEIFKNGDNISTPILQRKLKCGYNKAKQIFEVLEEEGLIERGPKSTSVSTYKAD